jgi:hypothetical protein
MFDELDEYICPGCGYCNELCNCDYELDNGLDDDILYLDESYEDDYPIGQPICYLDGKPLYKEDLNAVDLT